jgi:hypothetical protein
MLAGQLGNDSQRPPAELQPPGNGGIDFLTFLVDPGKGVPILILERAAAFRVMEEGDKLE